MYLSGIIGVIALFDDDNVHLYEPDKQNGQSPYFSDLSAEKNEFARQLMKQFKNPLSACKQ